MNLTGLTRSPSGATPEMCSRKRLLLDIASQIHPKRILEIGVSPGETSLAVILEAQKHVPRPSDVAFYGFDVFEPLATREFDDTLSLPVEKVRAKLEPTGAQIHLIKGDSKVTLPEFVKTAEPMALLYIDGGHSYATVSSDWECSRHLMRPGAVLVFDDYWDRFDAGCRSVVDAIDRKTYAVEIVEPGESIPGDRRLAPSYICRAVKVLLR